MARTLINGTQISGTAGQPEASEVIKLSSGFDLEQSSGNYGVRFLTASAFFGDGSNLTNVSAEGIDVTASAAALNMPLVFTQKAQTDGGLGLALDTGMNFNPNTNLLTGPGGLTIAGAVAGVTTVAASGLASLDGGINVNDDFTVDTDGVLACVGANLGGAVSGVTTLDGTGDLTMGTITMSGFAVDADGDTNLKSLAVDNSSTIGCDADSDIMTLAAQSLALANDVDFNVAKAGGFQIGGVAVTATAAELNYVDITAAGTGEASKALVLDGSRDVDTINALGIASMANNWTNAGITVADMGILTTVDINGGTLGSFTVDGGWTASGQTCADLGTVSAATSITATDLIGTNVDGILGADTARAANVTTLGASSTITAGARISLTGVLECETGVADEQCALNVDSFVYYDATNKCLKRDLVSDVASNQAGNGFQASNGQFSISWERQTFTSASLANTLGICSASLDADPLSGSVSIAGDGVLVYLNGMLQRVGTQAQAFDCYFALATNAGSASIGDRTVILPSVDMDSTDVLEVVYITR